MIWLVGEVVMVMIEEEEVMCLYVSAAPVLLSSASIHLNERGEKE